MVPNKDLIKSAISDVHKMSPGLDCRCLNDMPVDDFVKSGIAFVTYHFLSTEENHKRVRQWLGKDFDGMVRNPRKLN